MPIEFRCEQCDTLLRTPDDTVGRRTVCPECGRQMMIPYVSAPRPRRNPYVAPEADLDEPTAAPTPSPAEQMAIGSLILGIVSICFSCCCFLALPSSIAGLVLGIKGLDSRYRVAAIVGIVLSCIGLLAMLGLIGVQLLTEGGAFQGQQAFP